MMFLLSGLFVWTNFQRHGVNSFLRQRLLRLGIPFVVLIIFRAPITYYAMYLQTAINPSLADYWKQFMARGEDIFFGHSWFIWVLLAFDFLVVLIPKPFFEYLNSTHPLRFFLILITFSFLAYFPLVSAYGPIYWSTFSIFSFQTSRILHYLIYFLMGVGLGTNGFDQSFLRTASIFLRQWIFWAVASLIALIYSFSIYSSDIPFWSIFNAIGFVIFCATTCFAFLSVFLCFGDFQSRLLDSLSQSSFGMYIFHYVIVIWLQYLLLDLSLSPILKAAIVFFTALALSWG